MVAISDAAAAIRAGQLVVYPTETVYGLGADALDARAVDQVFAAKERDRSNPVSLAVPDVRTARRFVRPSRRETAFIREFLPGPVTVVVERRSMVPEALTAGRDRVGIRIPDHQLARSLLEAVAPITATSANRSGAGSVRRPEDLDPRVRDRASVVLDGGRTPGTESTVVDVANDVIHRRGAMAERIEAWLESGGQ